MLTRLITTRPSVRVHAKKDDSVAPADAPGEGKRRFSTCDELGPCEDLPKKNPIKKFIMDVFKIEEIDYEKFNKENMWAIRPDEDKE
jgi:hypothetical protein